MNDEGEAALLSDPEKPLHASVYINDKLRFAEAPLLSPSSSRKMVEEEKKKTKIGSSVKHRPKPIEIQCDSDDDEPIGSLLKLKKPRSAKRLKAGSGLGSALVEARAEDLKVGIAVGRGMKDTLASFKKKLKAPKRVRSGGSGVEKGAASPVNEAGPSARALMEEVVVGVDSRLSDSLEDLRGSKGKRLKVYPKSWTAVYMALDNVGMWNFRSEYWARQYLGQQFYLRVYSPVESIRDKYPIPRNALLCGRAAGRRTRPL